MIILLHKKQQNILIRLTTKSMPFKVIDYHRMLGSTFFTILSILTTGSTKSNVFLG